MTPTLDNPGAVITRLDEIEADLAHRQAALEAAARGWFVAKRDREHARAVAFLAAEGTVAQRTAIAERETALDSKHEEAEFEALKAVCRVLEARASIGMAILKAQGRF